MLQSLNQNFPLIFMISQNKDLFTWELAAIAIVVFVGKFAFDYMKDHYTTKNRNSLDNMHLRPISSYYDFEKFNELGYKPKTYKIEFELGKTEMTRENNVYITKLGNRVKFTITGNDVIIRGYEFNYLHTEQQTFINNEGVTTQRSINSVKRTIVIAEGDLSAFKVSGIILAEHSYIQKHYFGSITLEADNNFCRRFAYEIDQDYSIYRKTFVQSGYKAFVKQIERFVNDKSSFAPAVPRVTGCFVGAPGNGKSLFPSCMAKHFRLNLYVATSAELTSLASIKNHFRGRSFLVIPEIDDLVLRLLKHHRELRDNPQLEKPTYFEKAVSLKSILEIIDGTIPVDQILMASSNNVEVFDVDEYDDPIEKEFIRAFTRPGRFEIIHIENPTIDEAQEYFTSINRTIPKDFERCSMAEIARMVEK